MSKYTVNQPSRSNQEYVTVNGVKKRNLAYVPQDTKKSHNTTSDVKNDFQYDTSHIISPVDKDLDTVLKDSGDEVYDAYFEYYTHEFEYDTVDSLDYFLQDIKDSEGSINIAYTNIAELEHDGVTYNNVTVDTTYDVLNNTLSKRYTDGDGSEFIVEKKFKDNEDFADYMSAAYYNDFTYPQ